MPRKNELSEASEFEWRWFHTFKNGRIELQGVVEVILPNGDLRVRFFSWVTGDPTSRDVFLADSLQSRNMHFYKTQQDMCAAYLERKSYEPRP